MCARGAALAAAAGRSSSSLGAMETPRPPAPLPRTERFWSPRQIALAAFLGTPLAAGWFFSRNYNALADEARSRRALWSGLAATAAVMCIAFAVPRDFPNALLPAAYTFATERYASYRFGPAYQKYLADGGAKGSWWTVVGIGFTSLVLIIAVAIIIVYALAWRDHAQIDWDPRH